MKKLTMNRLASAGLRTNRRAYLSLAAGIFLSVFLIATMALSVQGIALDMRRDVVARMGSEDALLYDSDLTDEQLRDMGWFGEIGHATITGSIQDGAKYVGYYDETASRLLNRRLLEGRMPEVPGEIAVESTVLDMLSLDIHPGDALELEITPVEGVAELRQYALVGILADQSPDMSLSASLFYYDHVAVLDMPALLTCADEPAFQTGRLAAQRVMTLKKGKSGDKLIDDWDYYSDAGALATISSYNGHLNTGFDYWGSDFVNAEVFCVLLLGAALLLVCGIGIAGSMESRLAQRVEQIGMLRAVGATGRQIRRMYGREAWLLALVVSPLTLFAACAAVFAASRLLPDSLVFKPSPLLLLPVLGFSVIVVVLSASLPLRRASKIMPMQVLRDTRTLKKLRKVKSRRRFKPARLISARQGTLHAGRLIGPAALVALTMAVLLLATQGSQVVNNSSSADFLLRNLDASSRAFCDFIPDSVLSSGDIAQIAALPEVGDVRATRHGAVILEIDRVADYFLEGEDDDEHCTSPLSYPTDYLLLDNGWQDGTDGIPPTKLLYSRYQWAIQQRLGTDKKLISLELYAVDESSSVWRQAAAEGTVDMDAIDRGEQVLAYMPDHYRYVDSMGQELYAPYPLRSGYSLYWQNDYFHPGQALPLRQLRQTEEAMSERIQVLESSDDYLRLYADAQRLDATPTVGAVVTQYVSEFWIPCLVTTEKGAQAMGLAADHVENVDIWLDGPVDVDTEERLFQRVSGIAARGNMMATNRLKSRREYYQEQRMGVITFVSVAIVFLAAAVGLISSSIRRRVMADARAIGTLRAVGANAGTIRSCYGGQVLLTLLLGCAIGGLLFVVYWRFDDYLPVGASPALVIGTQAAALAAVWGACMLMLNRSVRAVTKKSIIDNIREL